MSNFAEVEYVAGQTLRACYEIVSQLELAKRNSDYLVEVLPQIYVLVDENGTIWSGNNVAAELFQLDPEDMLKIPLSGLFLAESWQIMRAKLDAFIDLKSKSMEFELPILSKAHGSRDYLWHLTPYQIPTSVGRLTCVIGQDISQIRDTEKQISQIFASLPIGIVTMDKSGKVVGPYSAYTDYLLGQTELTGKSLREILFESNLEKGTVDTIFEGFGCEDFLFESMKVFFPKEISVSVHYQGQETTHWLGVDYHPIFVGGEVHQLLVILENKTETVKARRSFEQRNSEEVRMVNRILEANRCDDFLLETSQLELTALVERLSFAFENESVRLICRTLHTIKGVTRTCGFSQLKDLAHSLEDVLLHEYQDDIEVNVSDDPNIKSRVFEIKIEFKELSNIIEVFSKRDGSPFSSTINTDVRTKVRASVIEPLKSLGLSRGQDEVDALADLLDQFLENAEKKDITTLEDSFKMRAVKTMDDVGKTIDLHFEIESCLVREEVYRGLSEVCLHLLNNAIDHAIETTEDRLSASKSAVGQILVNMHREGNRLFCTVSDDGKGLSPEHIKQAALCKKIITDEEAEGLSEDEAIKLIFRAGFSTATLVTDVSGRGIGLDAVTETVRELGGNGIAVKSRLGRGASFSFDIEI